MAAGIALVHAADAPRAAAALAALYVPALGVGTTLAGTAEADLRRAVAGLVLLALLLFTRFADWSLGYTVRGLVFIAFGAGFLALNLRLRRRREEPAV